MKKNYRVDKRGDIYIEDKVFDSIASPKCNTLISFGYSVPSGFNAIAIAWIINPPDAGYYYPRVQFYPTPLSIKIIMDFSHMIDYIASDGANPDGFIQLLEKEGFESIRE